MDSASFITILGYLIVRMYFWIDPGNSWVIVIERS